MVLKMFLHNLSEASLKCLRAINEYLHEAIFLETQIIIESVKKFPAFIESGGSSPPLQDSAASFYPELFESIPQLPPYSFPKIHSNIILPSTSRS